MLTMLKRHEIQVLLRAGHTQAEVARLAGVSQRSVRRIEDEPSVVHVDDAASRAECGVGRPSVVEPFRGFLSEVLEQEPRLRSVELLRRARLQGYDGGKSALYGLIASVRPKLSKFHTRFEGLAGEFSQHDFGEVQVRFLNGAEQRIHFFASRLKYSRWVQVSVVPDQSTETLVRTLVDHFAVIGGVPLLAVFDRPKTVALKWSKDGTVTEWNTTFAYVALELGLGIELCWPYSPQQKGAVENLVGWVKGSFFKQRRFHDPADLLAQLSDWHQEVNHERPCRATGIIPASRMAEERARLRPLRVKPEELALRIPITVGPTGDVVYRTNRYAMPPEAASVPGTLHLYRDRVKIVAGRFEADHPRLFGRNQRAILPAQRAERLAQVSGKRGQRYLKRQDLLETGPAALDFLTELVHRRPRAWYNEVDRLHELLQAHGEAALRQAFQSSIQAGTYGADYVAHFLRQATTNPLALEVLS